MLSRFVDEDLDWLIEDKEQQKEWDESKHPRVPAGSPEGGQFGEGGGGEGGTEAITAAAPSLHPEVINVGGDDWNKQTAVRLEKEYVEAAPKLETIVNDAVHGKAEVEQDTEEPDPDNAPYVPDHWDGLSQSQQDDALEAYKSKTFDEYQQSEIDNWYENSALDDAASDMEFHFAKAHGEPGKDTQWALDAINEYKEENRVPFTSKQLLKALTVDYSSGYNMISKGLSIDFDDSKLTEPEGYDPKQITMPGIEEIKPADFLTEDMRKGLIKDLEKAFESEAEDVLQKMEPPDYIGESIAEFQEESFSSMDDKDKFNWVEANTDIVSDAQKEYDDYFGNNKEGGETGEIDKLPNKFDPLQQNASKADYTRTQLIARHLSIERAANLMVERKILTDVKGAREIAKTLDRELWNGWKGSSHGGSGQLLQSAAHDELGGRLNPKMVDLDPKRIAAQRLNRPDDEAYNLVKAYMRAKWETSQYLLSKADINTVDVYRAVNIPYAEKIHITEQSSSGLFEFSHTYRFDSEADAMKFTDSEKGTYPEAILKVGRAKGGDPIVTATYLFQNRETAEQKVAQIEKADPAQHREKVESPRTSLAGTKYESSTVYERLPDVHIVRNGAASTSLEAKVSNDWDGSSERVVLRASVPRTAVISVPAYGQNVYGEHEVVVAGTAWKGWDAWYQHAPPFGEIPIGHQIAA